MRRDYTLIGLLANLLIFGGVDLLVQTHGVTASALSAGVIVMGVVVFGVFWRLEMRPPWRRARRGESCRTEAREAAASPVARS